MTGRSPVTVIGGLLRVYGRDSPGCTPGCPVLPPSGHRPSIRGPTTPAGAGLIVGGMHTSTAPQAPEALRMDDVSKVYDDGDDQVVALDGIDVWLPAGTFTAVMGPSGSGKSTFLHCAAGLDRPTAGRVRLDGTDVTDLDERAATLFRRAHVGFVFQHYNLLPTLTVRQNVTLPLRLARRRVDRALVDATLERLGLAQRADHLPSQLSGGQQQRAAIARTFVGRPSVVFADEPTGALDSGNARLVLRDLQEACAAGRTVVMVTHDPVAAAHADAVLFLVDGRITGRLDRPTPEAVAERLARLGPAAPGAPGPAAAVARGVGG